MSSTSTNISSTSTSLDSRLVSLGTTSTPLVLTSTTSGASSIHPIPTTTSTRTPPASTVSTPFNMSSINHSNLATSIMPSTPTHESLSTPTHESLSTPTHESLSTPTHESLSTIIHKSFSTPMLESFYLPTPSVHKKCTGRGCLVQEIHLLPTLQHPLLQDVENSLDYSASSNVLSHFLPVEVSTAPTTTFHVTPSMTSPAVPPPADQPIVNSLVAAYLIVVVVVSVVANIVVVVVRVCGRRRRVRSGHLCTLSLAVSDVAFSLMVHTLMILAALGVDPVFLFSTTGCNYYGFCAMFFGTFSMVIHACVSLIRYINICHPEKVEWLKLKYVYSLIWGCAVYSAGWALGPLFNWGRYETFEFGCTLAFSDPTRSGRSFVTCAFVFVLLLPLGVVVTCYSLIVIQAHKYRREMSRIADNRTTTTTTTLMEKGGGTLLGQVGSLRKTQRSLRLQNKLVRMSMVVAGGYVLGWLPYAVVCMWATYGDYSTIPIEVRLAASLICKSATAYNPFIYYFMSEGFRADLRWLGRRAGLIKHPIKGSTFHPSYRSSTRSSIKKSRDRTRENSMQTNASRKDSNSTCLTSPNLETPSTPLSPFTSPDTGDDPPVYLLSNPISISNSPRISNSCLRLSSSSLQQMEFIKSQSQITRQRKTEKPLSATDFLTDREFLKNFNPRRRIVNMTCDVDPLQYPCRRSVSFSMTPEASLHVVPSSPGQTDVVEEKPKRTLRSHSLYGSRSGKIIKTYPRRKLLRDSFMNTRV